MSDNFFDIGAELGREGRATMPIGDFLRIRDGIAPAQMVDAGWMLRTLRRVKSPAEVAIMRHVCRFGLGVRVGPEDALGAALGVEWAPESGMSDAPDS